MATAPDIIVSPAAIQPPKTLGEALERAKKAVETAQAALELFKEGTRGDLDQHTADLAQMADRLQETADDIVCTECGAFNNNGEGYDGLCGNCADRQSDDDGEQIDIDDLTDTKLDDLTGVTYGAFYSRSQEKYRGLVIEASSILKTTEKHYGSSDEAISAARMLAYGDEERFLDADQIDRDEGENTYSAIFYDDEDKWRGTWSKEDNIQGSTRMLYDTPAQARAAARQLAAGEDA